MRTKLTILKSMRINTGRHRSELNTNKRTRLNGIPSVNQMGDYRILEDGDFRILEDGDMRILE